MKLLLVFLLACMSISSCASHAVPAAASSSSSLQAIAKLEVPRYMGRWYQVALYPNRFQAQCVSDTSANYAALADGTVQVTNRCKNAKGVFEEVVGQARPAGATLSNNQLTPAKLEVRFAPAWLSWIPLVWGNYWVIDLPSDYRYAIVSEPQREYLWVLSRTPALSAADDAKVRVTLTSLGFDLTRLQTHTHTIER